MYFIQYTHSDEAADDTGDLDADLEDEDDDWLGEQLGLDDDIAKVRIL